MLFYLTYRADFQINLRIPSKLIKYILMFRSVLPNFMKYNRISAPPGLNFDTFWMMARFRKLFVGYN